MPLLESEALVYTGSDGLVRFCQLTAKLSVFVLFKVCPSGISHCHVLVCWVWLENHEITLCFHLVENIKVKFPINFGACSCVVTEIYTSLKSPRKFYSRISHCSIGFSSNIITDKFDKYLLK